MIFGQVKWAVTIQTYPEIDRSYAQFDFGLSKVVKSYKGEVTKVFSVCRENGVWIGEDKDFTK